jgi:predicted transcriptional regulator
LYLSKLQICVKILCALAADGPLRLGQLIDRVELDRANLKSVMDFLYDHCVVGIQDLDEGEGAYFVTERGLSVLRVVGPLIKEAQRIQTRNYEAISDALSVVTKPGAVEKNRPKRKWKLSDLIRIEVVKEP